MASGLGTPGGLGGFVGDRRGSLLGGATGVSLCGIVLEWRLLAHGDALVNAGSSAARLAAFNESFLMLAALCLLAMLAAWQLRGPLPTDAG